MNREGGGLCAGAISNACLLILRGFKGNREGKGEGMLKRRGKGRKRECLANTPSEEEEEGRGEGDALPFSSSFRLRRLFVAGWGRLNGCVDNFT